MTDNTKLNIVDEKGNIIGEQTRRNIHRQGLLHREVHVWFYTPNGEIIFQHRARNSETYPDLLDATVGGHVEIGQSYEDAALQEMKEETGVCAGTNDIILLQITKSKSQDKATGLTNNVLRAIYAYRYTGAVRDLKIEGEALGFEAWPFVRVFAVSAEDRKRFIPFVFSGDTRAIFKKIQEL